MTARPQMGCMLLPAAHEFSMFCICSSSTPPPPSLQHSKLALTINQLLTSTRLESQRMSRARQQSCGRYTVVPSQKDHCAAALLRSCCLRSTGRRRFSWRRTRCSAPSLAAGRHRSSSTSATKAQQVPSGDVGAHLSPLYVCWQLSKHKSKPALQGSCICAFTGWSSGGAPSSLARGLAVFCFPSLGRQYPFAWSEMPPSMYGTDQQSGGLKLESKAMTGTCVQWRRCTTGSCCRRRQRGRRWAGPC